MYEESIRVPAFIHWPERIKPGRSEEFITAVDMGPTILEIAEVEIPATMQGKSFLPLALREAVEWR